ncbi:hypothetical protein Hanom_Chr14g01336011 [Helianthus anomalus]
MDFWLAWELCLYLALLQGPHLDQVQDFQLLHLPTNRITIFTFKTNKTTLVESANLSVVDSSKENPKRLRRSKQPSERVHALSTAEAPYCSLDLDYHEAAAELDSLYKFSPTTTDEVKKVDIVRSQRKSSADVVVITSNQKRKPVKENEDEKINRLVSDYSTSTDFGSLDWKKIKIPLVLPSSEHTRLFKLLQTMKVKISCVPQICFFYIQVLNV